MEPLAILKTQWESLLAMLPRQIDLEETSRQSGALQRRRAISDAATLLRLALVYGLSGLSLRATAAWAELQGLAVLSDVALLNRLRKAATWLGWLLTAKLAERLKEIQPESAAYRLRVVDATTVCAPGSRGTDYRVHLGFELGSLNIDRIEITGAEGGETFSRLTISPGDLVLADRGYCHRQGLAAVRQAGGDFLVRINWQNLPLQDGGQQRIDLMNLLDEVPGEGAVEFEVWTMADKARGIAALPARLILARKPDQAAETERRRILRSASRKGRNADPRTLKAAGFFFVLTSVPQPELSADQALALYRLRWQIEITFKRLKVFCISAICQPKTLTWPRAICALSCWPP